MLTRRTMLGFIAAPAIVRATSLMPINAKLAAMAAAATVLYLSTHYRYGEDGLLQMRFSSSVHPPDHDDIGVTHADGWTLVERSISGHHAHTKRGIIIEHRMPSMAIEKITEET